MGVYYSEKSLENFLNAGNLPSPLIINAKGGVFNVNGAPGEFVIVEEALNSYPNPLATGERALIGAMLQSQIDSGNWDLMDSLVFMNLLDATNSLWDIKRGSSMTAVNDPTHSPGIGRIFNGSTQFINSNYNPSTFGGNYKIQDCLLGAFVVADNRGSNNIALLGSRIGTDRARITFINDTTDNIAVGLNDENGAGNAAYTLGELTNALIVSARTSNTINPSYKNGVSKDMTSVTATTAIPNNTISIGARHVDASFDRHWEGTMSSFIAGAAIGFNHSDYFDELTILNTGLAGL